MPSELYPSAEDESFMLSALALAAEAGTAGEVPVGAVVVKDGAIVAQAANARHATGDPTAHAEVVVLRAAAAATGEWRLTGSTLYVTLEPCPMCAGALVAARVSRLVFGAADLKGGACGSLYNLCSDPRLNHELPVVRGVLGHEAAEMLSQWFAERRQQGVGDELS